MSVNIGDKFSRTIIVSSIEGENINCIDNMGKKFKISKCELENYYYKENFVPINISELIKESNETNF